MHMLQFSCEKTLLQSAVNTASRTVAAKSSIPALEGLLLEGDEQLTVSGYNMQTGIRTSFDADIREGGRIVLNARLFGEIIRKMPDDVIVFSADDKLLVRLSCGDASFEIPGLSAEDYPRPAGGRRRVFRRHPAADAQGHDQPDELRRLHKREPPGPHRLALRDQRGGTDGRVRRRVPSRPAARALERIDGGAFRFVAPGSALNEVEKICEDSDSLISIIQGKRHLLFETGSTQLIAARLRGGIPRLPPTPSRAATPSACRWRRRR